MGDHEPPIGGLEGSFQFAFTNWPCNPQKDSTTGSISACAHPPATDGYWFLSAATWRVTGQAIATENKLNITTPLAQGKAIKFHIAKLASGGTAIASLSRQSWNNTDYSWILSSPDAPVTSVHNDPRVWKATSVAAEPAAKVRIYAIEVEGLKTIQLSSLLPGILGGTSRYEICHSHDTNGAGCGNFTNPYVNQTTFKPFPRELLLNPELIEP